MGLHEKIQVCKVISATQTGRMDGWMDGWMDEWMDGWIDLVRYMDPYEVASPPLTFSDLYNYFV